VGIIIICLVTAIAVVAAIAASIYGILATALNLVIGRVSENEKRISQLEETTGEKQ
jgi:hypothetical protein